MTIKVNIATLKNELSRYLRKVREGTEIVVTDRERPFARILPLSQTEPLTLEESLALLERDGLLENPFGGKTRASRLKRIAVSPGPTASDFIVKDRE